MPVTRQSAAGTVQARRRWRRRVQGGRRLGKSLPDTRPPPSHWQAQLWGSFLCSKDSSRLSGLSRQRLQQTTIEDAIRCQNPGVSALPEIQATTPVSPCCGRQPPGWLPATTADARGARWSVRRPIGALLHLALLVMGQRPKLKWYPLH